MVIRNSLAWLTFTGLLLYLIGHYYIPQLGPAPMQAIVGSGILFISLVVSITYWPAAKRALDRRAADDVGRNVLNTWLIWTALAIQRIWTNVYIMSGRPTWMLDLPISGLLGVLVLVSGYYAFILPPTKLILEPSSIRLRNWTIAGSAAVSLVSLTLLLIYS